MGDYAITLMMDESENFLKIDDGLSFDFDNYECAPEEVAERFKDNESDNHEIGNCFLKIEKRITIITMFELNADFFEATFALVQICSPVNTCHRYFSDIRIAAACAIYRSVNPHSRCSDKEHCTDRRSTLLFR